jgi:acyl carrier protein
MTEDASAGTLTATPDLKSLGEEESKTRFLAVMGEVIGVDTVVPGDHFLDVGGDSLSAAILIDWISQEFGVEPELDWFFESQTVQDLADTWWNKVRTEAQGSGEDQA